MTPGQISIASGTGSRGAVDRAAPGWGLPAQVRTEHDHREDRLMGISLGCVALMAGGIGLLSGWFGELPANAGHADPQADLPPELQAALQTRGASGNGPVFGTVGQDGIIVAEAGPPTRPSPH